jgi:alpha-glucosidase
MDLSMKTTELTWWKKGVIYHIYPLSFMDSNNDGIGDIPGIISRLDYLKRLGVDAIWLSPVYESPMADLGYDISDYTAIHSQFGTMSDLENLIKEGHTNNVRIIMDFVPNHTSEKHPWFLQSRSSRDNPRRDWYIWRDPAPDGSPPTNWLSSFGGSGWEFDKVTEQYYYHSFLKQQPDLNLRNSSVIEELQKIMKFWLDKGIDGFRVDVMWHLIKDDLFRDNPPNPGYRDGEPEYHRLIPAYSTDQPDVMDVVYKLRKVINSYTERVLIGEIYLPINQVVDYYGFDLQGAHLPLNFQLLVEEWNAQKIYKGINEYEGSLPSDAWPNWVLSNHDRPRVISRIGTGQARVAALLLLTLRGTPTIYYGDEIAMENTHVSPDSSRDLGGQTRDAQRTPMQWNPGLNAGFTNGTPWLEINKNYKECNVETQQQHETSMLNLYKKLIYLRKSEQALNCGNFKPVGIDGNLFAFLRTDKEGMSVFLIAVNISHNAGKLSIPGRFNLSGEIIFSTGYSRNNEKVTREIILEGDEGIIVKIDTVER